MTASLHYTLQTYIPAEQMPLWVIPIARGTHSCRNFHDHNISEIVVILHGPGVHLMNGKAVPLRTGDVLVVHPGAVHAYDQVGGLELVNILYDSRKLILPALDGCTLPLFRTFFPDWKEPPSASPEPVLHLDSEALEHIAGRIQHLNTELRGRRPGCSLFGLSLLIEIAVELCRMGKSQGKEKDAPYRIGEAVRYMNAHYAQPVSVDELAKKACMSRRSFFLQFKNAAGCSPVQYLMRLRIMHATELLLYSRTNISGIAWECGFTDSNYFCRKFREFTGVSPRQYRLRNSFGTPQTGTGLSPFPGILPE